MEIIRKQKKKYTLSMHREFFDCFASKWDDSESSDKINRLKQIFYDLNINRSGNILDIGCGTGVLVPFLLKKSSNECHLFEVDLSKKMLRENKKKCSDISSLINYIHADTHNLPFKQRRFNFVVCFEVLPHLSDQLIALKEWKRVLAVGGYLLILHLMGSKILNAYHASVNTIIAHDHLLPLNQEKEIIKQLGLNIIEAIERDDLYLILSQKK
jgi:ubiquinone/menaquinone biosynthesis C-methylase UbiE